MVSGVKKIRKKRGGNTISVKINRRQKKANIFKITNTTLIVKYKFFAVIIYYVFGISNEFISDYNQL